MKKAATIKTRKIIRNGMRREGGSKYLHSAFEQHQNKSVGVKKRTINEAKGTHKKRTWRARIATALNSLQEKKI